jgi:DNA-binding NarL/FixJ family response regulator
VIRVLIADDHSLVRDGVQRVLDAQPDMSVCGHAANGEEALAAVASLHPDVVVLDVSMPRLGGLETLQRLRQRHPEVRTILLSYRGDPPLLESALALGARGYVLKNAPSEEIVAAIREVAAGGCHWSAPLAPFAESAAHEKPGGTPSFVVLSGRERQTLRLIAEGLSAKEIGAQLGISAKTVEAHRTSLMRKLGARKATDLVRYAVRHGFVDG